MCLWGDPFRTGERDASEFGSTGGGGDGGSGRVRGHDARAEPDEQLADGRAERHGARAVTAGKADRTALAMGCLPAARLFAKAEVQPGAHGDGGDQNPPRPPPHLPPRAALPPPPPPPLRP